MSTRFLDGPAEGVMLRLRRAPLYLRVVRSRWARPGEGWDALDQLHDTPRPGEVLVAYRRHGSAAGMHLRPGGRVMLADYVVVEPQPDPATMRDTDRWRAWCREQVAQATKGDDDSRE